ncbi:hypothetical protein DFH28DRAFT_319498 [Melampsora americana]|nr:hypothetical protein DFH28DRAFT_319498 [Melampsora americana]
MMKSNRQRLLILLLSINYHIILAIGEKALGDVKRILKFDLNEPPPPEIEDTNLESDLTKYVINDDESHERGIGLNSDLANNCPQNSRPVPQPAIQTSDLEMGDRGSHEPQGTMEEQHDEDPHHPDSRKAPVRETKTRLLSDIYQSGEVCGKSDHRARRMTLRAPSKKLSSTSLNITPMVIRKTSDSATSSKTSEAGRKKYFPQDSPMLRKFAPDTNHKRESKMKLTRISSMRSKNKEALLSTVYKMQPGAKGSKQEESPHESLTFDGRKLLRVFKSREKNRGKIQKKGKYPADRDYAPDYDPQETDEMYDNITENGLSKSMEVHLSQTDGIEEIRDISTGSQIHKQAELRREIVRWYKNDGFSLKRTAEKFGICDKTVRRYVNAAKFLQRQGASSSASAKKNILNSVRLVRYPDKFKRWAIKYHFKHRLTHAKTARALGIPRGSLTYWLNRYPYWRPGSTEKAIENDNMLGKIQRKKKKIRP